MIEIVRIEDLRKGDIILIEGIGEGEVNVVTIHKVDAKNFLIIPKEMSGLDYAPEDPDNIVRIGTKERKPKIRALSPNTISSLVTETNKK